MGVEREDVGVAFETLIPGDTESEKLKNAVAQVPF